VILKTQQRITGSIFAGSIQPAFISFLKFTFLFVSKFFYNKNKNTINVLFSQKMISCTFVTTKSLKTNNYDKNF